MYFYYLFVFIIKINTLNSRKIELITLKAKYQIITVLFLDEDILFLNQESEEVCSL